MENYIKTKQLSDSSWEAVKTFYDPETGKESKSTYIVKNIENDIPNELLALSKETLSKKYMVTIVEHDRNYVISEVIEGISLKNIIENSQLDYNTIIKYMSDLAEDVEYIHRNGIAHQNIKPSNIILDGSLSRLRLTDFTKACTQNNLCSSKGETYYTPPELQNVDDSFSFEIAKAHDMWSLGVVFYQLANSGSNYIDFSSANENTISKDIVLLPVKPSLNSYQPINELVGLLLDKTDRINATQLLAAIPSIRPKCRVNETNYTRTEAESILLSLGKGSEIIELLDSELCSMLTSEIKSYNLNGRGYTRFELTKLANLLGIEANLSTEDLYSLISRELDKNLDFYRIRATADLLNMIEIISDNSTLQPIFDERYELYRNNTLIDISMLQHVQKDVFSRFNSYKIQEQDLFITTAMNKEKIKNNMIVKLILNFQPDIQEYEKMLV
jgi:serine/threonine protein kinase